MKLGLFHCVIAIVMAAGCVRAGFTSSSSDSRTIESGTLEGGPPGDGTLADGTLLDGNLADDAGCHVQQLQILSNLDDGEFEFDHVYHVDGESWPPDPAGIYIGWWQESRTKTGRSWGFFRFQLTSGIPVTATVASARLDLWGLSAPVSSASWSTQTHALRVLLEAATDAQQVNGDGQCPGGADGRLVVQQSYRWPPSGGLSWKSGAYNSAGDLAPLFQALVLANKGLAKGAHVQLWVRGELAGIPAEVATPDFGRPGYKPARLTLQWCP